MSSKMKANLWFKSNSPCNIQNCAPEIGGPLRPNITKMPKGGLVWTGRNSIRTTTVSSVCEFDAPDAQIHSKVDRPPWVCCWVGFCTVRRLLKVCCIFAVVGVPGVVSCILRVCVRTDLVRWTVQCHVHIESTIHRHCWAYHMTTLSFSVPRLL